MRGLVLHLCQFNQCCFIRFLHDNLHYWIPLGGYRLVFQSLMGRSLRMVTHKMHQIWGQRLVPVLHLDGVITYDRAARPKYRFYKLSVASSGIWHLASPRSLIIVWTTRSVDQEPRQTYKPLARLHLLLHHMYSTCSICEMVLQLLILNSATFLFTQGHDMIKPTSPNTRGLSRLKLLKKCTQGQ
jgi:hypothetical protein